MPNNSKAPRKGLSDLEHQLMEILWKSGPGTAEQIREALAPKHALKDSTIRTVLKRLQEKGYVTHKIEGKAFVYSGVEKPRNVAVRAVRQILDRFCDGSLEQLLVGLVENEVVDRAELQQLARKVARRKE
ncbi:Transcriptional repressor, CopY family [Candidatus Sulfopaludibacter sp. SbA3]|nr:Transcriptional repressor, CopY family [Candidatus Sulfopaludibacter sp. SbA3]